jgi:hypothetical protein
MPITMYSASVPIFTTMLGNLSHFLDKAQANAGARNFNANVLVSYRLAPDMLPFSTQINIACDAAKLCVARISGVEAPKFEDTEATMAELQERISKTLAYLNSVPAEKLDGTEMRDITFPVGRDKTRTMTAEAYLKHWAMPNMFFHVSMAYAILRHNGVDLGKSDYLLGNQAP